MKKMNFAIVSVLTLMLGSILAGCTYKNPQATFSQQEIVVSINDSISLDDYLSVKEIAKKDIKYKIANPSMFLENDKEIRAVNSGTSLVYATYKNNSLASMRIVVKKQFSSPTNFSLSESGLVSWSKVSNFFENETAPTVAKEYQVSVSCLSDDSNGQSFSETVVTNSYQLPKNGIFKLKVKTLGEGYFEDSEFSEENNFYFGFMDKLTENDLTWNSETGILSWSAVAGAKYKVKFNEVLLKDFQSTNSIDLSDMLSDLPAGSYDVSVVVYDTEETNPKLATESEILIIKKLETPTAEYVYSASEGGKIKIESMQGVETYVVVAKEIGTENENSFEIENNGGDIVSAFDELKSGVYQISIKAISNAKCVYESNSLDLGAVYKLPQLTLAGLGNNQPNSSAFNIKVSSLAVLTDTNMRVEGAFNPEVIELLKNGEQEAEKEIEISSAGIFDVFATQIAKNMTNEVSSMSVYVLNSAKSESLKITKLNDFQNEVTHEYKGECSVLSFDKIENALNFDLLRFDGEDYVLVNPNMYNFSESQQKISLTLNQKIENIEEFVATTNGNSKEFKFKIVAKTNNDSLAINSIVEKSLVLLPAPTSAGSGNSTNKTYSWNDVNNADGYKLEIYQIDAETYQQNQLKIDIDIANLNKTEATTEIAEYTFASNGYYYVKIYSTSQNSDHFISSLDCMEEVFYISDKLEVQAMLFGKDDAYETNYTSASGYFLKIENSENISRYEVLLNGSSDGIIDASLSDSDYTIYLFSEKFDIASKEYQISVIGYADDSKLYQQSETKTFTVEKLKKIEYADLEIDELTEWLTINKTEGVSKISIKTSNTTINETEGNARLSLKDLSNENARFILYGSQLKNNIYESPNQKVWLQSEESTFNLVRLQAPTDLLYYNETVTFVHDSILSVDHYVLDLICQTANSQSNKISIKFKDSGVVANVGSLEVSLGNDKSEFLSISNNKVTIKLSKIIEFIKNSAIASIYNQTTKIEFAVYGYQNRNNNSDVLLSSNYASVYGDTTKNLLGVEKMKSTSLSFEDKQNNYVLTWDAVATTAGVEAETVYEVYINGTLRNTLSATLTQNYLATEFDNSTYYTFYVRATNPYYLESNNSNEIKIYKLRPISKLTLLEDGSFGYQIVDLEKDFCDNVKILSNYGFQTSKNGKFTVEQNGDYTLNVVGKTINSENNIIKYIDSASSVWTIQSMDALIPLSLDISYQNKLLSWEAFGKNQSLNSLSYILIFKDSTNKTAVYKTTDISVNLLKNEELRNSIAGLGDGEISIQLAAYLESYSVFEGGTIYFAKGQELLNGTNQNNCFIYNPTTIVKLTSPEVVSVEYQYEGLSESQYPDIKIVFAGNYGESENFNIFLNSSLLSKQVVRQDDGNFNFVLTSEDYNNSVLAGQQFTIEISASSEVNISSTPGTVVIKRAKNLTNIQFEKNGDIFNQVLTVNLDPTDLESAVGGLVMKFEFLENGREDSQIIYKDFEISSSDAQMRFDVSDLLEVYLRNGGTVTVSAFVNNFSNNETKLYFLANPEQTSSTVYNVLKSVDGVNRVAGGFSISDGLNSKDTVYVIQKGSEIYQTDVSKDFYFEFPNTWANGEYTLNIFAKQPNYISSSTTAVTFVLDRISKVSSIMMQRNDADDISKVTLSWNSVEGASAYIFRFYRQEDTQRQNLLYEYNSASNSVDTITLFGKNFEKFIADGKISAFDLLTDLDIVVDVMCVGTDKNNSQNYSFNATIKGSQLRPSNFEVNQFGILTFETEIGREYLYRLVSADGLTELEKWKTVKANSTSTKIDTKNIDTGVLFNVEVVLAGSAVSESADSNGYAFMFDSNTVTTVGNDLTFQVNIEIQSVGFNPQYETSLVFDMVSNSFTKIYVGLSEDAILTENVIEIVPELQQNGDAVDGIYIYSISAIIDAFEKNGMKINVSDSDIVLYMWSYLEIEEVSRSFVISKPYKYAFGYVTDTSFVEIKKMGAVEDVRFAEDFANTFALFNIPNESLHTTVGMFVKIRYIPKEDEEGYEITKLIDLFNLSSEQYFLGKNLHSINLTKVFESEDLAKESGMFEIEFARLQIKFVLNENGNSYNFVVSDWIKNSDGSAFVFERLPEVTNLSLSAGSLTWKGVGESSEKYYVYFMEDLINQDLGENYKIIATTNTFFNASDFAGTENFYYLAVQSINENPFIISSKRVFIVSSGDSVPVEVYKNQFNSKLTLRDGKFVVDWNQNDDFYTTIMKEGNFAEIAKELCEKMFISPFTFSLNDLLTNRVMLRVRFTDISSGSEGKKRSYDVNAKLLLSNLYDFDENVRARLITLFNNANNTSIKNSIQSLQTLISNGSHGIANSNTIFDDIFETLQKGKYKVDYCLIGNSKTLNSTWYNFENENGENVVYVSAEPSISAIKQQNANDISLNSYKVLIEKSQIYKKDNNEYKLATAENYVLKLSTAVNYFTFSLVKGIENYSLSLTATSQAINVDNYDSISVFECNESGFETAGGNYLMFFINHNNGDSILGKFNEVIEKSTYNMQIYAVGNNVSISSKSEYFSLTLFGFGNNFAVNNGEFTWTTQINRNVNVVFKKNGSVVEGELEVDGSMETASFSLEGYGNGLYDYIKFITFGEIKNKNIFVDSEIYMVENVYKLATPELTNNLGYIAIDDSKNIGFLENSYSDSGVYNYKIYNDKSTNVSYTTFYNNSDPTLIYKYEAGTTRVLENDTDFNYHKSEEDATEFSVASLGTSSQLLVKSDLSDYHIKHVYCKNGSEEVLDKQIALKSQFKTLQAVMLDEVEDVRIENGVLNWNAPTGNSDKNLTIPTTGGVKTIYRIIVTQYKLSNTELGESETSVGDDLNFYTTENYFDFTNIQEDDLYKSAEKTYLKATVQAFAGYVVSRQIENSVRLVDGNYAYGNLKYQDSEISILMSNGNSIKNIDRISSIDENSLKVANGQLVWTYTTPASVTEQRFFERFAFVVTDRNNVEITGQYTAKFLRETATQKVFEITFAEDKGQMQAGVQILNVYASQGSQNTDLVIKSFAKQIEVAKLASIVSTDYSITSDTSTETLDMSQYFKDENLNNTVLLYIEMLDGRQPAVEFELNSSRNKLFILRESQEIELPLDFAGVIVVEDNQVAKMTFKVENRTSLISNVLYSNISDEFLLQRSNWGTSEENKIVWNDETQKFSWIYDGFYSLQENVSAEKVEEADVVNANTVLYNDSALQENSSITLEAGQQIDIQEVLETSVRILFEGNNYFVDKTVVEKQFVKIEDVELHAGDLYKIESRDVENSLIVVGEELFQINSSSITDPIYLIEVVYGDENSAQVIRTYTSSENSFAPTIIGKVKISVRIKLGNSNIQSNLLYSETVDFDLFENGQGSYSSPYLITTAQQLKNISYRMSKDSSLMSFYEGGLLVNDSTQFYFMLGNDITVSEDGNVETYINGTFIKGNFSGVLEGDNKTISYIANNVSLISNNITVSVGNILAAGNEASTTYKYGVALFENFESSANVKNFNLKVKYASAVLVNSSLMAGLVIQNGGKIENINLIEFSNDFTGVRSPTERLMMVYSGIASINYGGSATIKGCNIQTSMVVNDNSQTQVIFLSGIVYTNYAIIEDCVSGDKNLVMNVICGKPNDSVQVAGIAITNTSYATIRNCTNKFDISVEGTNPENVNKILVYIAGITDLGLGTLANIENLGSINTTNIGASYLHSGLLVPDTN